MKYYKLLFVFILLLLTNYRISGQKPDPKIEAIEKHYQYLEVEVKAHQESMARETTQFREFIQSERKGHQEFLELTYTIAGILISLILGILTFFGWNTFKGIQESKREIEQAAASRLLEFERSMNHYKEQFTAAQQDFQQAAADYNKFLSYYKDINPIMGRYLLIGAVEKLEVMKEQEIPRFEVALGKLELLSTEEIETNGFYEASYDVIIYRYSPTNDKGEDEVLEKILLKLKNGVSVPILVYSVGQSEYIKGTTDSALKNYGLFHVANNPVTLIDNAASTYRVSKLSVQKQSKQI